MSVDAAIAALRAGRLVVLPTDTVYGLAADGESVRAARALYAAKGRDAIQPTAVLFASVDVLLGHLPALPTRAAAAVRALLPGPFTLVLENPARRYAWLNQQRPDAIGVRVPALTGPGKSVLETVGAKSGAPRRNAVIYFHDGERVTIVASNAGSPRHPAWYHNLRARPDVTFGGMPMRATVVDDEAERARLWPLADNVFPAFAGYRRDAAAVNRRIPIVQLIHR